MADELEQLSPQILWRKQVANRLGAGALTLSVSATTGFLMIPHCSGVPTGTPTGTGSAIVIDTTNNRLYFYSSGLWRNAGP